MYMSFDRECHIFKAPELSGIVKRSVNFFSNTPLYDFPPSLRMNGAGLYGLYYFGDYALYSSIAEKNRADQNQPIYIGQAMLPGKRTGINRENVSVFSRLQQHSRSIFATNTLNVADFKCRFIFLDGDEHDLIGAIETGLIKSFLPLWNSRAVDGFGNHDPGAGRYKQQPSAWDTLHPGRAWVKKLNGKPRDPEQIIAEAKRFLQHPEISNLIEPDGAPQLVNLTLPEEPFN